MGGALSERFDEALLDASRRQRGRVREGTGAPYLARLLAVAALVLDHGGDEDEAIAALCHDAVGDPSGASMLAEIERRFGPRVAGIIAGCTATDPARLRTAPAPVVRVAAAARLHDARTLLAEYRRLGEALWDRFGGGRRDALRCYRTLIAAYREAGHAGELVAELDRAVAEIERLARSGPHGPTAIA